MLAVFPLDVAEAPARAIKAVVGAQAGMAALNARRQAAGQEPLGYGIGVHVGDVMYGNIGSRSRLDFTVIGPAVNVASRLESLTKDVRGTALFSGAFVGLAGSADGLDRIGSFRCAASVSPWKCTRSRETTRREAVLRSRDEDFRTSKDPEKRRPPSLRTQ